MTPKTPLGQSVAPAKCDKHAWEVNACPLEHRSTRTSKKSRCVMATSPIRKTLELPEAIRPEQLPLRVPRRLGALFAAVHIRTLVRAEKLGLLVPLRRGSSSGHVVYDRSNFLRWCGIDPREATKPTARDRLRKHAA